LRFGIGYWHQRASQHLSFATGASDSGDPSIH
jgi:hypothetical protein